MLKTIKALMPLPLKKILIGIRNKFFDEFAKKSYSQEGEDMILRRIFEEKSTGFYIDVGAHHPRRFSNTFYFYKEGWSGVNIEPNPDSFGLFKRFRPHDININYGIAKEHGSLSYYMFDESALNTFDQAMLISRIADTPYKHIKTVNVHVAPLSEVLAEYVPRDKKIDFLTVDVEGLDLEVLKSNNWTTHRPEWVLVEQLNLEDVENLNFELHDYMKSLNYILFAKTFNTLFYKDRTMSP